MSDNKFQLDPMYDINGFQVKLGDTITFDGGKGRIHEYLGNPGDKFGARVRVFITETGSVGMRKNLVDIALLLNRAEYVRPGEPTPALDAHHKYGV